MMLAVNPYPFLATPISLVQGVFTSLYGKWRVPAPRWTGQKDLCGILGVESGYTMKDGLGTAEGKQVILPGTYKHHQALLPLLQVLGTAPATEGKGNAGSFFQQIIHLITPKMYRGENRPPDWPRVFLR